jgi:hypothetical protein
MTIKQLGGVFGRNPTFNDVTIEGELTFDGDIDINSDLKIDGDLDVTGGMTVDTDTLVVDNANNRVGIGTDSPSQLLNLKGAAPFVKLESNSTSYNGFITNNDSGNFYFGIDGSGGSFYGSSYARAIYADGAYPVTFYTNAQERLRILSTGGITFNGDTAQANALDDYEEGTWTPNQGAGLTVTGAFSSTGLYTKVGRVVTITGTLSGGTNISLASPGVIFTNIPFATVGSSSGAMNTSALNGSGTLTIASGTTVYGNTCPAVSTIYFALTYTAS